MKRFYEAASVDQRGEGGFAVLLDGHEVKTPAKAALRLPAKALAEAIAEEWTFSLLASKAVIRRSSSSASTVLR